VTDAPIGIFDSGFGGLTVARAVMDQLPHEAVVYLGDTARQPYGPKPIGEVREYALEVILPATRRAVAATRSGRIGVICTRATAQSLAYEDAFAAAPHIELTTQVCPRFVDLVEQGVTSGPELQAVAHEYLDPLTEAGVDTLILGCTHYPLLTGVISLVMGDGVTLVSSAEECAKDVYRMLVQHGIERDGHDRPVHRFLTTGQPEEFATHGRRFLGPELEAVTQYAGGGWVVPA